VLRGDAHHLPLPDNSVDLIVTSPPYFALRSYTDGGVHYPGQVGAEATPAEFVDALVAVTRECVRVLKPSGSIFVNLGDKYAGSVAGQNNNGSGGSTLGHHKGGGGPHAEKLTQVRSGHRITSGVRPKSLIGIPWRYALRCIDDLGLILRAEVIWSKPNGLPESVTDRVRRSHEQWFHFVTQPRYFSAVDEIREPATTMGKVSGKGSGQALGSILMRPQTMDPERQYHPLGKLPGSVWTVPTEPLRVPEHLGVDHFAAFPTEWPRRIVAGWSPSGVCTGCGEVRRPVVDRDRRILTGNFGNDMAGHGQDGRSGQRAEAAVTITGYACACPDTTAPTRPAVVLDPFGGTGTTAHVAHALGRHGISVDMSADYSRIAADPTVQDGRLRKILGVAKVPAQVAGQGDLWDEVGA